MRTDDGSVDGASRTGRIMAYGSWILAALLLTWLFSGLLERQRNPNSSVRTSVGPAGEKRVVLERNRFGHYVANGRINGKPVEFLLDTGATVVSVPERVAVGLGLEQGPPRVAQTANGRILTYATTLDSVEIGAIKLADVGASINPHSSAGEVLLGMTFLKHLELTQRGSTLTIKQ
jgi:aspartyl protease family protein